MYITFKICRLYSDARCVLRFYTLFSRMLFWKQMFFLPHLAAAPVPTAGVSSYNFFNVNYIFKKYPDAHIYIPSPCWTKILILSFLEHEDFFKIKPKNIVYHQFYPRHIAGVAKDANKYLLIFWLHTPQLGVMGCSFHKAYSTSCYRIGSDIIKIINGLRAVDSIFRVEGYIMYGSNNI